MVAWTPPYAAMDWLLLNLTELRELGESSFSGSAKESHDVTSGYLSV